MQRSNKSHELSGNIVFKVWFNHLNLNSRKNSGLRRENCDLNSIIIWHNRNELKNKIK